ncbi:Catenin alpha-3 [Varanus komodoensis]|nr:Catenin alpha-3 [Varanus komodoensis]
MTQCHDKPHRYEVINAALALAARPKSQVVKSNMEMYKNTWENHIRVLTEAVDDITSIDDFLAVSEFGIFWVRNRLMHKHKETMETGSTSLAVLRD